MKQIKREQQIKLRGNKIVRVSIEEVEIKESEIAGEIIMINSRIAEARKTIESETKKLEDIRKASKNFRNHSQA